MATLFYDTFQGAGEFIEAHTSDSGGGWTKPYGSPLVVTDGAVPVIGPASLGFNVAADATGYTYPSQFACATAAFDVTHNPTTYYGVIQIALMYPILPGQNVFLSVTMSDGGGYTLDASGLVGPIPIAFVQGLNTLQIRMTLGTGAVSYLLNDIVVGTAVLGARGINMGFSVTASGDSAIAGQSSIGLVIRSAYLYDTLTPTPPTPTGRWWRNAKNATLELA